MFQKVEVVHSPLFGILLAVEAVDVEKTLVAGTLGIAHHRELTLAAAVRLVGEDVQLQQQRLVLVIDEYPLVAGAYPELAGFLEELFNRPRLRPCRKTN